MHLSTPRQSKKDASLLCGLDDPHGSRRMDRCVVAVAPELSHGALSRQRFRIRCVMAIYKEGRKKLGKSQRACQSVRVFWRALPFKMDNDTMERWSPDRLDVCVLRLEYEGWTETDGLLAARSKDDACMEKEINGANS